MVQICLKNKKINRQKLIKYGFKKVDNTFIYKTTIADNSFSLSVELSKESLQTKLVEIETGEIYTLHLVDDAKGEFVGKIRTEYNNKIEDILKSCFDFGVFEWEYSNKIIEYAKNKYGTKEEYLWEKFPRNAVCRRADNKKWYFALLSVKGTKLGLNNNDIVEIINVKVNKESVPDLLKQTNIYPAYHMNKKSWITIILDGSMKINDIYKFIDKSYELAK